MLFPIASHARSRRQVRNILLSFVYRGGTMLGSLLMVPMSLSFLSPSSYGTWQVVYSILSWTMLFDLGLGNGLKNRLSEAIVKGDLSLAAKYVSTHYVTLLGIAMMVIGLFTTVHAFVDWYQILNVGKQETYLSELIWVGVAIFAVRLVLESINSVLLSYQRAAAVQLNTFLASLVSLGGVWVLIRLDIALPLRLPLLGFTVSILPALLSLGINFYFFGSEFSQVRPSLGGFQMSYVKRLFSLGGQFFIIQLSALIIYSTDNFLISRLFGPSQVTLYNIALKYFSCFTIAWNIIIIPYWVAFSEAFLKGDYGWIKKTVSSLLYLWLGLVAGLIVAVLASDHVYRLWIGHQIIVPKELSIAIAVSVAITSLSNVFAYFVNGITKIRLQLVTSVVAAIINIPLAVFLSSNLDMGLKGVVSATSICILLCTLVVALQYHKIINGKASGIWNQ